MIGGVGFGQPPGAICQGGPSSAPFPARFLASPPSCCGCSAVQRSREPPCAFLWDFRRPCRLRQGCGRQKGPLCPAQTSQLPGSSPRAGSGSRWGWWGAGRALLFFLVSWFSVLGRGQGSCWEFECSTPETCWVFVLSGGREPCSLSF